MVTSTEPESTPLSPLVAAIGNWRLDPSATTIEISTKAMWGLVKVKGRIEAISGHATFSRGGVVDGALVIAIHTLDTKNALRDKHLRGSDFFDVDRYPTLTYAATGINTHGGTHVQIRGALTIKGRTRPTDLDARISEASRNRLTLSAETEIDRGEWGIGRTAMDVDPLNRIMVVARFTRVGLGNPRA